ncbi:MAG TPA: hypothetical protein VGA08_01280 [Candidatus Saccharimonadales bacterium]
MRTINLNLRVGLIFTVAIALVLGFSFKPVRADIYEGVHCWPPNEIVEYEGTTFKCLCEWIEFIEGGTLFACRWAIIAQPSLECYSFKEKQLPILEDFGLLVSSEIADQNYKSQAGNINFFDLTTGQYDYEPAGDLRIRLEIEKFNVNSWVTTFSTGNIYNTVQASSMFVNHNHFTIPDWGDGWYRTYIRGGVKAGGEWHSITQRSEPCHLDA